MFLNELIVMVEMWVECLLSTECVLFDGYAGDYLDRG